MHSCLYEGRVEHQRHAPKRHAFGFGMYLCYLDLDELDHVFDSSPLWSTRGPALSWWRRADYLDPSVPSLAEAVRRRARALGATEVDGPIRMLTHLRTFGYVFNPVTFYYGFDAAGGSARWVLAEITNTPWDERHAYLVPMGDGAPTAFGKEFHVSPFLPMDMTYRWRFSPPGERLEVHMENDRGGEKVFEAHLQMRRRPIERASLHRVLWRYPLTTLGVIAQIHWQAVLLWAKRVPFHPHPARARAGRREE